MNAPISIVVDEKARMAKILFWLFVTIFAITAVFAFLALSIVFLNPSAADDHIQFGRLVWALWGAVLAEVATGIFALWKNVFGLSAHKEVATSKNVVGEIIDGLESNGDISEEKAEALRREYSNVLGPTSARVVRES